MVQPTPPESRDERRRRLLSATRRAESSIDEALINYGEGEQARNRERVNQEIEKFLPGVTEDEQSPIGMYMPSAENFPKDYVERQGGDPESTHMPMRRVLFSPGRKDPNEGIDQSHPDYIKPWTTEEENQWLNESEKMRYGVKLVGTAPGDYPRQHEITDLSPTFNQGDYVSRDSDMFDHGYSHHASESVSAPFNIDRKNVMQWAAKHRKEVKETGIQDTEWKQRFERLKGDIIVTNLPISKDEADDPERLEYRALSGSSELRQHLNTLEKDWNFHSSDEASRPSSNIYWSAPRSRTQERSRTRGPGRQVVTRSEVANRFAEGQTGRTSGRNFRVVEGGGGYTGRLDTGISETPSDTDTHTVYSYATPIAWRRQSGEVVMPTHRFSSTTNRHQSELRRALENQGYHSPQRIANQMLYTAYRQDARRASAGRAIGRRHYETGHDAEVYYPDAERAHDEARAIADTHYERINAMRQQRAASATARRSGSRTQRREQAGQLRLPTEGDNA